MQVKCELWKGRKTLVLPHLSQVSGSHCECSEFQISSSSWDANGGRVHRWHQ